MPLVTPTRLVAIILSFSLITFFWTFGLPQQLAQPELPALNHYDHKNAPTESIKPPAAVKETHAKAPRPTAQPTASSAPVVPVPTLAVDRSCKDAPGAQQVMVVLKTSKAEIDNLSSHFNALLSCVPHFAIFSDHAGEFNGHPVHDALDSIGDHVKSQHAEFDGYNVTDAEHKPDAKKMRDLDKWKMLPMVYKAYHLKPDARFFVFIQAETSLSWTNLLQWLSRLDYRIPYYSGAPIFNSGTQLAQAGAGIMLSQGALRRYTKSYDELYTSRWEKNVGKECCGDLMLARAFTDAHVEFYSSWPLLQTEQPHTLDYTKRHWCVPAVSWYHINGESLMIQWKLEKNWTETYGLETPYLYRDAFLEHVEPHLEARKESWDNLSGDAKIIAPEGRQQQLKDEAERNKHHQDSKTEDAKAEGAGNEKREDDKKDQKEPPDWDKLADKFVDAADSADQCLKACEQTEDCLQWRYIANGDGECHLAKMMRLGSEDRDGKWTSGWLVERIREAQKGWTCEKVQWKFYQ